MEKCDCTNCGWGIEWKLDLGPHGEERLSGLLELLTEKGREVWDNLPPELQKEFEAQGLTRP